MLERPIALANVNTADDIFINDEGSLQGNTAESKTNQVKSTYINIPRYLMERYE